MRETQFIRQNEEKWAYYEDLLTHQQVPPEALQEMFIQITDDLSYARTFYPSRSVRAYLNGVAQRVFVSVYRRKRGNWWQRIKLFFTDELPQVILQSHSMFFWATVLFFLSFAIGYFSSVMDEDFPRLIMGESYIRMTTENIRSGNPMAVYQEAQHMDMTFGIMLNNLWVTYFYFVLGVFAGVGSVAMMMYNGVMVGAFLQFFARSGLAREANLTIWMHGTFEISAIIIGTAAGMTMGSGWLFPQTYTRLQSFQMSARRGIKIMMGVTVLLFFAAFFEGNLTRYTQLGDLFRATFVLLCLLIVLGYYVWYPLYKSKMGFLTPLKEVELPPTNNQKTVFGSIKTMGEIFNDTFTLLQRHLRFYLLTAFSLAVAFVFMADFFVKEADTSITRIFYPISDLFSPYRLIFQCFDAIHFQVLPLTLLLTAVITTVIVVVLKKLKVEEFGTPNTPPTWAKWFRASMGLGLPIYLALFTFIYFGVEAHWFILTSLLFGFPLVGMIFMAYYRDELPFFRSVSIGFQFYFTHIGQVLGANLLFFPLLYLFFWILSSGVFWTFLQIFSWNIQLSDSALGIFEAYAIGIFTMGLLLTIIMLLMTCAYLCYTSVNEIQYAENLLSRIEAIGNSRKIQGLVRETHRTD